jgi:hypothetical protein
VFVPSTSCLLLSNYCSLLVLYCIVLQSSHSVCLLLYSTTSFRFLLWDFDFFIVKIIKPNISRKFMRVWGSYFFRVYWANVQFFDACEYLNSGRIVLSFFKKLLYYLISNLYRMIILYIRQIIQFYIKEAKRGKCCQSVEKIVM